YHELIEADSLPFGLPFQAGVEQLRQTDYESTALLGRCTFDKPVRIDGLVEKRTDSLVLFGLEELFPFRTGRVSPGNEAVDRIKQGIGEIGPRFDGGGNLFRLFQDSVRVFHGYGAPGATAKYYRDIHDTTWES